MQQQQPGIVAHSRISSLLISRHCIQFGLPASPKVGVATQKFAGAHADPLSQSATEIDIYILCGATCVCSDPLLVRLCVCFFFLLLLLLHRHQSHQLTYRAAARGVA